MKQIIFVHVMNRDNYNSSQIRCLNKKFLITLNRVAVYAWYIKKKFRWFYVGYGIDGVCMIISVQKTGKGDTFVQKNKIFFRYYINNQQFYCRENSNTIFGYRFRFWFRNVYFQLVYANYRLVSLWIGRIKLCKKAFQKMEKNNFKKEFKQEVGWSTYGQ